MKNFILIIFGLGILFLIGTGFVQSIVVFLIGVALLLFVGAFLRGKEAVVKVLASYWMVIGLLVILIAFGISPLFQINANDIGINGIENSTQPGLVSLWHLDERSGSVAYDSYGNNNGTISGASWTTGISGSALSFNGYDSYVNTSPFNTSTNVTVSFWFKANRVGNGQHGGGGEASSNLISHWGNSNGWWVECRNSGSLELGTYVAGTYTPYQISPSFSDTVNWHHIAFTITQNGSINLWMDGIQKVGAYIRNWQDANTQLLIGSGNTATPNNPTGSNGFFNGTIDEVQIYNRTLTQSEILSLYGVSGTIFTVILAALGIVLLLLGYGFWKRWDWIWKITVFFILLAIAENIISLSWVLLIDLLFLAIYLWIGDLFKVNYRRLSILEYAVGLGIPTAILVLHIAGVITIPTGAIVNPLVSHGIALDAITKNTLMALLLIVGITVIMLSDKETREGLVNFLIRGRRIIIILAVLVLLGYSALYLTSWERPGVGNPTGWMGWCDQGFYYRISDALAKGKLPERQNYMYGLGYPIILVPFSFIFPNDRVFVPDAVIFTIIILITYATSIYFLNDKLLSLIPVILLLTMTEFTHFFIEPWNNIVTAFGIASIMYMAFQKLDKKRALAMGLILGWVFSARYVDMLFLLPLAAVPLLEEGVKDFRKVLLALIPMLIIMLAVLATHQIVFGNALSTPYDRGGADLYNTSISVQDLRLYDVTKIPTRLYALTIDPMSEYRQVLAEKGEDKGSQVFNSVKEKTPLIDSKSFFLIFAPVGIIVSLIMMKRRGRMVIIGWALSFISSSIFYLSFIQWNAGWTPYWRYFSTWMPSLVIFATVGMLYIANLAFKKLKGFY